MPTAPNLSVRLSDRAKPWVLRSLKELSPNEPVIWELAVTTFPDPSTVPLPMNSGAEPADSLGSLPALVIYLEIEGPEYPKDSIFAAPILPPFSLTYESVHEAIRLTLDNMRADRDTRRKALTASNR